MKKRIKLVNSSDLYNLTLLQAGILTKTGRSYKIPRRKYWKEDIQFLKQLGFTNLEIVEMVASGEKLHIGVDR